MKTKEAPEKIYVPTTGDEMHYHMTYTKNEFKESIEYTRTDAFIEKAKKYIANHFLAPGMDNEIKDFVNYMKKK